MNPKFFSHVWAVIHLAALNYKRASQQEDYINFYNSLADILGCPSCIDDYKNFIKTKPPNFRDLFGWTVELHNHVNTRRGEPTYTREESFEYWRSYS